MFEGMSETVAMLDTFPKTLRYQMLFLVIAYLVPMTLMSLCYTVMGKVLWGSQSIGELTQRQIDSIRSKRKEISVDFKLEKKVFLKVNWKCEKDVTAGKCYLPYLNSI
ncbi:unnamed protein product [Ceutorhynchus assimilis]|uniref:Uncharacterized protein n=1 Tax=Ceutorhynchus assimilis TaxID=467358 RepID=A0A9N9MV53_9CUCU|nr:unnamed protein product [Ceutorhynchus assimilis]